MHVPQHPKSWALCGITPIHKGGDTQDPGNYRGIAVGSLLAKLYACILNELLISVLVFDLFVHVAPAGAPA